MDQLDLLSQSVRLIPNILTDVGTVQSNLLDLSRQITNLTELLTQEDRITVEQRSTLVNTQQALSGLSNLVGSKIEPPLILLSKCVFPEEGTDDEEIDEEVSSSKSLRKK